MNVLYVEDDPRDADLTQHTLAKTAPHLSFETASSIAAALTRLERIDEEPLDLVLTDMHLRDGDGLSLLNHIRENSVPVAVVIITGVGDEETAVAALKARADDYVVKRKAYLDKLPVILESAFNHYRADAARREHPLRVLYLEDNPLDSETTRRHFAVHADHIHLEIVTTVSELHWRLSDGAERFDVVLMDYQLAEPSTLQVLRELSLRDKQETPIVLVCNEAEEELARQGLKLGASSCLVKRPGYLFQLPWEFEQAHARADLQRREAALHASQELLKTALKEVERLKNQLHEENVYLQEEIRVASNFGQIIGNSEALRRVLYQAEQVAPLDTTVSLFGETGTGKELLAHAIHKLSGRHNHSLVKVNCAALPGTLIESELFGHEKGAFTGADAKRSGRFEIANGGTLFLDEVGELPLDLQTKLLRVLEEGEFERVGGSHTIKVDVRVIAATNRNLEDAVRQGVFRSDLYYRLSIFPITLPPLRERKEDVPVLVRHLIKQLSQKLGKTIDAIPLETMAKLRNYPWPGNVRELRNVIERAVIVTQGSKLQLIDDLDTQALQLDLQQQTVAPVPDSVPGTETLEQTEYNVILRTLQKVHWKVEGPGGAAELLNLHPSTLRSKMRKLGIERPQYKTQHGSV
ncbi:MAG TPA: sigma 54-interacting transcriptional regulator [Pyrinomonadaceae bacterium]|nr:sigma 54-interacting transcriptional regulator [Pyrinomonadaceae bacterium]